MTTNGMKSVNFDNQERHDYIKLVAHGFLESAFSAADSPRIIGRKSLILTLPEVQSQISLTHASVCCGAGITMTAILCRMGNRQTLSGLVGAVLPRMEVAKRGAAASRMTRAFRSRWTVMPRSILETDPSQDQKRH